MARAFIPTQSSLLYPHSCHNFASMISVWAKCRLDSRSLSFAARCSSVLLNSTPSRPRFHSRRPTSSPRSIVLSITLSIFARTLSIFAHNLCSQPSCWPTRGLPRTIAQIHEDYICMEKIWQGKWNLGLEITVSSTYVLFDAIAVNIFASVHASSYSRCSPV